MSGRRRWRLMHLSVLLVVAISVGLFFGALWLFCTVTAVDAGACVADIVGPG